MYRRLRTSKEYDGEWIEAERELLASGYRHPFTEIIINESVESAEPFIQDDFIECLKKTCRPLNKTISASRPSKT